LRRNKLDANRPIEEAACGQKAAEIVYGNYHGLIRKAIEASGVANGQRCLLLDLHGQAHSHNHTEIGYLLRAEAMNAGMYPASTSSSVRALAAESGLCGRDLLTGEHSLGAAIEARGYPAIPSPSRPAPGGLAYFRGGYTTQMYGSWDGGRLDAIQLEMPKTKRVDAGPEGRENYAVALAAAVAEFYRRFYSDHKAD